MATFFNKLTRMYPKRPFDAKSKEDFTDAVRALDRVLLSGFYIVPLYHAPDQWFAYSTTLARPERNAQFAAPLFGATLDTWWRKAP